ncbi:hypothetical protein VP01_2654g1 [Puccinia sorghi]|uniref:Retroviral polymerase SH3-like domain-containing protein n=1 Tax=Puccinia sorghi TaxID=27349 RepID=A0A0L6V434_9BASI|nr:hypothetical protein VP01_2654g1 [Puccinia sorghi]
MGPSKLFEELHLDLIGPISPVSQKQHKYILTMVDANTRFCSAIPIQAKSNVFSVLTLLLDTEAKRRNLWNEVLSACMLTLNQIPTHKSNKSPYELFKNQVISLEFFRPIGNPVVAYSHHKKTKLDPKGSLGRLLGFEAELKSYKILMNDGKIINSKNVEFLNFEQSITSETPNDELLIEKETERPTLQREEPNPENNENEVKTEEEEDAMSERNTQEDETEDEDSENSDQDVETALIPQIDAPVGRILCERTLRIKPLSLEKILLDGLRQLKMSLVLLKSTMCGKTTGKLPPNT